MIGIFFIKDNTGQIKFSKDSISPSNLVIFLIHIFFMVLTDITRLLTKKLSKYFKLLYAIIFLLLK